MKIKRSLAKIIICLMFFSSFVSLISLDNVRANETDTRCRLSLEQYSNNTEIVGNMMRTGTYQYFSHPSFNSEKLAFEQSRINIKRLQKYTSIQNDEIIQNDICADTTINNNISQYSCSAPFDTSILASVNYENELYNETVTSYTLNDGKLEGGNAESLKYEDANSLDIVSNLGTDLVAPTNVTFIRGSSGGSLSNLHEDDSTYYSVASSRDAPDYNAIVDLNFNFNEENVLYVNISFDLDTAMGDNTHGYLYIYNKNYELFHSETYDPVYGGVRYDYGIQTDSTHSVSYMRFIHDSLQSGIFYYTFDQVSLQKKSDINISTSIVPTGEFLENDTCYLDIKYDANASDFSELKIIINSLQYELDINANFQRLIINYSQIFNIDVFARCEYQSELHIEYLRLFSCKKFIDNISVVNFEYEINSIKKFQNITMNLISANVNLTNANLIYSFDSSMLNEYDYINDITILNQNISYNISYDEIYNREIDIKLYTNCSTNEWAVPSELDLRINNQFVEDESFSEGFCILDNYNDILCIDANIDEIVFDLEIVTFFSYEFCLDAISKSYLKKILYLNSEHNLQVKSVSYLFESEIKHSYINNNDFNSSKTFYPFYNVIEDSSLKFEVILEEDVYLPLESANNTAQTRTKSFENLSNNSEIILENDVYPANAEISIDNMRGLKNITAIHEQSLTNCNYTTKFANGTVVDDVLLANSTKHGHYKESNIVWDSASNIDSGEISEFEGHHNVMKIETINSWESLKTIDYSTKSEGNIELYIYLLASIEAVYINLNSTTQILFHKNQFIRIYNNEWGNAEYDAFEFEEWFHIRIYFNSSNVVVYINNNYVVSDTINNILVKNIGIQLPSANNKTYIDAIDSDMFDENYYVNRNQELESIENLFINNSFSSAFPALDENEYIESTIYNKTDSELIDYGIEEFEGHKNVRNSSNGQINIDYDDNVLLEYWGYPDINITGGWYQLISLQDSESSNGLIFYRNNDLLYYDPEVGTLLVVDEISHQWHHFRILIQTTIDKCKIWIDNVFIDEYNISTFAGDKYIQFANNNIGGFQYLDAIDISTDPNYFINRNQQFQEIDETNYTSIGRSELNLTTEFDFSENITEILKMQSFSLNLTHNLTNNQNISYSIFNFDTNQFELIEITNDSLIFHDFYNVSDYFSTDFKLRLKIFAYNETSGFILQYDKISVDLIYYSEKIYQYYDDFSLQDAEISINNELILSNYDLLLNEQKLLKFTTVNEIIFDITVIYSYEIEQNFVQMNNVTTNDNSVDFRYFYKADRDFRNWYVENDLDIADYSIFVDEVKQNPFSEGSKRFFTNDLEQNDLVVVDYSINPNFKMYYEILDNNGTYCNLKIVVDADLELENVTVILSFNAYFENWGNATQSELTKEIHFFSDNLNKSNIFYLEATTTPPKVDFSDYQNTPGIYISEGFNEKINYNGILDIPQYSEMYELNVMDNWELDGVHYNIRSYAITNNVFSCEGFNQNTLSAYLNFSCNPIESYKVALSDEKVIIRVNTSLPVDECKLIFKIPKDPNYKIENNRYIHRMGSQGNFDVYALDYDLVQGENVIEIDYEIFQPLIWWQYLAIFGALVGGLIVYMKWIAPYLTKKALKKQKQREFNDK